MKYYVGSSNITFAELTANAHQFASHILLPTHYLIHWCANLVERFVKQRTLLDSTSNLRQPSQHSETKAINKIGTSTIHENRYYRL